jgi:hypothetical protein
MLRTATAMSSKMALRALTVRVNTFQVAIKLKVSVKLERLEEYSHKNVKIMKN